MMRASPSPSSWPGMARCAPNASSIIAIAVDAAQNPQMTDTDLPFRAPRRLRAIVRAREVSIVVLAAIVGVVAGLVVVAMGVAVSFMHSRFFGLPSGERLSAIAAITPLHALIPAAGGIILGF